jgi:hypothetical protein
VSRVRVSNEEMRLRLHREEAKALLRDKKFRSLVLRYLNTAGILSETFRSDPIQAAYAAGRRDLGLELLRTLISADETALHLIAPTEAEVALLMAKPAATDPEEQDDGPDYQPFER